MKEWSKLKKTLIVGATLLVGLGVIGAVTGANGTKNSSINSSSPHQLKTIQQNTESAKKLPVAITKTIIETQSVPFNQTSVNSSSLAQGTSKITTVGVNGTKTLTYKVTYTEGVQTSKTLTSTTITTPPINQVTSIGTYVAPVTPTCTNGTYVNSAGNTVCSPEASPTTPAGATAQCVDGTYSFSQSRSGTCSHHGGVSVWY